MKKNTAITKAMLFIFATLLSLFLAEALLRIFYLHNSRYYVWQPNTRHTFHPDSTLLYGVHGTKNFTINMQGTRGDLFTSGGMNRLFIGGSTTECLYLDDCETWCFLWDSLEQKKGRPINSAGIGKSGTTSLDHYLQLKYVVPQLPRVNEVVVMVGLNDMMKHLSRPDIRNAVSTLTPASEDSLAKTFFWHRVQGGAAEWWQRTALFALMQNFYHRMLPGGVAWMIQDDRGESEQRWRQYRAHSARLIDSLPDLTEALADYRQNLEKIYREAQRQHLRLVWINQAAMYRDTMNVGEQRLLWMGGIGEFQKEPGHAYYTAAALRKGLDRYNEELKSFCQAHQQLYVDINNALPRDTSVFYDDCHFNEHGARILATYLAQISIP